MKFLLVSADFTPGVNHSALANLKTNSDEFNN